MHPQHLQEWTFPARDERFGQVVARLSEPTSAPRGDNFMSNEDSYPRVAGELGRRVGPGRDVYLGVGPDQNFTYIARSSPALAFVLDFRRRNALVHLLHKALISLATDRAGYLERLTARRPGPLHRDPSATDLVAAFASSTFDPQRLKAVREEMAAVLRPLEVLGDDDWAELATIQSRIAGPGLNARFLALPMYPSLAKTITTPDRDGFPAHWLASEASYTAVRERQLADCVIPLVGDFAGTTAVARLGRWLRVRGLSIDVLYVSDVEFFLLRAGKFDAYVANLGALPWTDHAVIVRTSTREIVHPRRVAGDSSTTIVVEASAFLGAARGGKIKTADDLFR
jgi:hypothetical protein